MLFRSVFRTLPSPRAAENAPPLTVLALRSTGRSFDFEGFLLARPRPPEVLLVFFGILSSCIRRSANPLSRGFYLFSSLVRELPSSHVAFGVPFPRYSASPSGLSESEREAAAGEIAVISRPARYRIETMVRQNLVRLEVRIVEVPRPEARAARVQMFRHSLGGMRSH